MSSRAHLVRHNAASIYTQTVMIDDFFRTRSSSRIDGRNYSNGYGVSSDAWRNVLPRSRADQAGRLSYL